MKRFIFFFIGWCFAIGVSAQNVNNPLPPSPNAASLGIFGKIPVDYFTGIPSIEIPVYNLTSGSLSVPVSLSYHPALVKPDQHPGWVGLGWNLDAGGAITRKVNSGVDEFHKSADDNKDGQSDSTIYSYIDHYSALNTPSWYSESFIGGHNLDHLPYDLDPDEFDFNFGTYSGSFYLDHHGVWQVRSNTPVQLKVTGSTVRNFRLQSFIKTRFPGDPPLVVYLPRIYYSFVITTEDGTQYQFGNDTSSIEFTRPLPTNSGGTVYTTIDQKFKADDIIANTWMLTKIKNTKGDSIVFKYQRRDGTQTIKFSQTSYLTDTITNAGKFVSSNSGAGGLEALFSYSIINPVFLAEADAKHATLLFKASKSYQKDYALDTVTMRGGGHLDIPGETHPTALYYPSNTWKKLDTVQLLIDQTASKNFLFSYKDDTTSRLMLLSFQEKAANGKAVPPYLFHYNPTPLPPYNSYETDHWGFYNGRRFLQLYPAATSSGRPDFHYLPQYYATKQPVAAYLFAGVLDSLTYPTGGTTRLVFEPNTYSAVNGRYPFQITNTVTDSLAGGLRIHYIKDYSAPGVLATTKEYLYQKSGSTRSSGIVGGKPVYSEYGINVQVGQDSIHKNYFLMTTDTVHSTVHVTYHYWYGYSIVPMSYSKGSPIGYSRVIERNIGPTGALIDGYKVYTYSNFDNPVYQDKPAIAAVQSLPVQFQFDPYSSTENMRGLLLTEENYDNSDRLIKKTLMTYDTTINLSPHNVRSLAHFERTLQTGYRNIQATLYGEAPDSFVDGRYIAYWNYTNKPFLTTKEVDTYSYSPNTQVSEVTNYFYDDTAHNQVTRTVTTRSNGQVITALNTYPNDYSSGTTFIDKMKLAHEIALPIEQVVYQNDANGTKILHGKITEYKADGRGLPDKIYHWESLPTLLSAFRFSDRTTGQLPYGNTALTYNKDGAYHLKTTVNGYDAAGNIRMYTDSAKSPVSYKWGYNKTYPIAEVKNADTTEFYYEGFEASTASGVISSTSHTGTNSSTATTVSWTRPNSRSYVISYWYKSGNTWKLSPETAYTGSTYTLSGGTAYDDIRIFPVDAQITTYTYSPMIGMTSVMDTKGNTTYYTYDELYRLASVKDKDGNILKRYCYNYAGVDTGCTILKTYVSSPQSATFYKSCPSGYNGTGVVFQTDTGQFSSTISKANADSLAMSYVMAHGQANADSLGQCIIQRPYVKFSYPNTVASLRNTTADLVVSFYNDAACTVPYTVTSGNSITVQYKQIKTSASDGTSHTYLYNGTCTSGTSLLLGNVLLSESNPSGVVVFTYTYTLTPGGAYQLP